MVLRIDAQDQQLASGVSEEFSVNERYILSRYHEFCHINALDALEYNSGLLLSGQMLSAGCRHSYIALYVRTVKKFCKWHARIHTAARLEALACRVEYQGRDNPPAMPAELTSDEVTALERHPDQRVSVPAQLMRRGTLRMCDVRELAGHQVDEGQHGFLLTLRGGKNHRRSSQTGKVTIAKMDASPALSRRLKKVKASAAKVADVTTDEFNLRASEALGKKVTSRSVRQRGLDELLTSTVDIRTNAPDYPAAALKSNHQNWRTLRNYYHKRALPR